MVALPDSMGILKTFNVADIFPYYSSEEPMYPDAPTNSRVEFFPSGGDWCGAHGVRVYEALGPKRRLEVQVCRNRSIGPVNRQIQSTDGDLNRIRQKLSVAAPEASAATPEVVQTLPIWLQDDSRVSHFKLFTFLMLLGFIFFYVYLGFWCIKTILAF